MKRYLLFILFCATAATFLCHGANKSDKTKPRWMTSSLPQPKSPGYIFVMAQGTGSSLEEARQHAVVNLTSKLEHERGLVISSSVRVDKTASRETGIQQTKEFHMEASENGKQMNITCRVVDEYWERTPAKGYEVTELFTVNDNKRADQGSYNDNIRLTTSYGAAPVLYSLIPGVGQFAKGSYAKGGLLMGGTAVGAAAVVLCETQRADYAKKMKEKPQHLDFYRNKKSTWETGRNIALGVTAAVYLYNLIDAAAAPGRRRVVVKKQHYDYALAPVLLENGMGIGLAMNF